MHCDFTLLLLKQLCSGRGCFLTLDPVVPEAALSLTVQRVCLCMCVCFTGLLLTAPPVIYSSPHAPLARVFEAFFPHVESDP